jgi:hypothetical protein
MTPDTIITTLDGSHHILYLQETDRCRTWCGKRFNNTFTMYSIGFNPTPVCEDCLELFVSFEESKYV